MIYFAVVMYEEKTFGIFFNKIDKHPNKLISTIPKILFV